MATTNWVATSGDWNKPSNWSDGVPTSVDAVAFALDPQSTDQQYDVTGDGPAAALDVGGADDSVLALTGSHTVDEMSVTGGTVLLGSTASLTVLQSLTIDAGATLALAPDAAFASPAVALSGTLSGGLGVFSSPLAISGTADITSVTGTLAGAITGSSADVLELGSSVPRDNSAVGSIVVDTLSGVGILDVDNDSVVLAGRSIGSVTVLAAGEDTISAVSANTTIFHSGEDLTVIDGTGAATVIGEVGRSLSYAVEGDAYGGLDVQGGSGRVTVFGEDDGGAIFGGTAGGNVIVAGSSQPGGSPTLGFAQPVTIAGGGNGDLLVATGGLNNLIAAAGGNETLTGAGATGNNTFFGGAGADEIVAGSGNDTIVGGSGAATIFGGAGMADIFAGAGAEIIVGGLGQAYIQAGAGQATVFASRGADLFGVVNGQSGGGLTIVGFRPGIDLLHAQGYASAPQITSAGGNTTLTFTDHTTVTLAGVTSLTASSFV